MTVAGSDVVLSVAANVVEGVAAADLADLEQLLVLLNEYQITK